MFRSPRSGLVAACIAVASVLSGSGCASIDSSLYARLSAQAMAPPEQGDTPTLADFDERLERDELVGARLDDIADRVCDGQSMPLLLNLVHKANFSSADLDRFRAMLDELDGPATGEGEPC